MIVYNDLKGFACNNFVEKITFYHLSCHISKFLKFNNARQGER